MKERINKDFHQLKKIIQKRDGRKKDTISRDDMFVCVAKAEQMILFVYEKYSVCVSTHGTEQIGHSAAVNTGAVGAAPAGVETGLSFGCITV